MTQDPKMLALQYMDAVSKQEFDTLEAMLAPDFQLFGLSPTRFTPPEFIAYLKRLTAIHVRNEVKRVFADADEACVIYDFVTDTPAGALPTIEWLRFERGRIRAINLYYDRLPWKAVLDEMTLRAFCPRA